MGPMDTGGTGEGWCVGVRTRKTQSTRKIYPGSGEGELAIATDPWGQGWLPLMSGRCLSATQGNQRAKGCYKLRDVLNY